jgi:hypothetical protein
MFEFMQETVDALCRDMENNPHNYIIDTYTFHNINTPSIKYWAGSSECITEIWNGRSPNKIFDRKQGDQLYKSFVKLREVQASVAQQKVINSMKPKSVATEKLSWWGRLFS